MFLSYDSFPTTVRGWGRFICMCPTVPDMGSECTQSVNRVYRAPTGHLLSMQKANSWVCSEPLVWGYSFSHLTLKYSRQVGTGVS